MSLMRNNSVVIAELNLFDVELQAGPALFCLSPSTPPLPSSSSPPSPQPATSQPHSTPSSDNAEVQADAIELEEINDKVMPLKSISKTKAASL